MHTWRFILISRQLKLFRVFAFLIGASGTIGLYDSISSSDLKLGSISLLFLLVGVVGCSYQPKKLDTQNSTNLYKPFVLIDDEYRSLMLSDRHFGAKEHIFRERASEGWEGGGYDWASIARVAVKEKLPHLESEITYDPEAGMFSAQGSRSSLQELAKLMRKVYQSEEYLRDLLSR